MRADLVDLKQHFIYEIKPENYPKEEAKSQLEKYVDALNDLTPGLWSIPENAIYNYSARDALRWLVKDIMDENKGIERWEALSNAIVSQSIIIKLLVKRTQILMLVYYLLINCAYKNALYTLYNYKIPKFLHFLPIILTNNVYQKVFGLKIILNR